MGQRDFGSLPRHLPRPLRLLHAVVSVCLLPPCYSSTMNWAGAFRLQAELGARVGEVLALRAADIERSADGRSIVRIQEHEFPDGTVWRPKSPAAIRALLAGSEWADLAATIAPESLLFFPTLPRPPSRQLALYHLRRLSGNRTLCTHDLRRARIVQSLKAGADPATVARAVGHRNLWTTLKYVVNIPLLCELPPQEAAEQANGAATKWQAALQPASWRKT